jgi:ribosomal protein L7/L12
MMAGQSFDQAVADARQLLAGGRGIEVAIRQMRAAGLSQIECVKAVKLLNQISLGEAKEIVHYSETWSDVREDQERLHAQLDSDPRREF